MCPVETPPGAKPPSGWSGNRATQVAAYGVRAVGQPGRPQLRSTPSSLSPSRQLNALGRVAAQRRRQRAGVGLVVGVRVGEAGALHLLRGLGDLQLLVAVDLRQRVVERVGRVHRVADLVHGAPALRGPLLEEPRRVAVAAAEVAQAGLLVRRGQGDRRRPGGQAALDGDRGDQPGVPRLRRLEHHGVVRRRRRVHWSGARNGTTSWRTAYQPTPASSATHGDAADDHRPPTPHAPSVGGRSNLSWRAAPR